VKLRNDQTSAKIAERVKEMEKELAEQIKLREELSQKNNESGTLKLIQTRELIKKLQRNLLYHMRREESFKKFKELENE
jgi:hypothetical protein